MKKHKSMKKSRKSHRRSKGFTMIELILVITVLAILAISALPVFYDVTSNARDASREGVVGSIQSGINVYRSNALVNGTTPLVPATLDSASAAACSTSNPCFTTIIQNGITDGRWVKVSDTSYTWAPSVGGTVANTYTYNTTTGSFQ